ncbi:MAG: hypothetical protein C6W58_08435 [Bacillaceae bacterium]|uniref:Uncharacterized protein n=1 Tax=Aeribacillus composti TaxID=1868734 RepID=A0ABY9WDI9_9BACI|nr:hypothetical protein [Aeribacillus composti]REJ17695.1 MAG: hypothetical protein C6W58_08435 [Bacillaceae bacterium]REJ21225.1 MAG: hypothetical protein C6W54_18530 [Bacillaceae bacterium]WNF34197.1 hypothetical protein RI196_05915 [Aeribacillus composti]
MRMILSDVQMRQLEKIIGMSNMCPDVLTFRAVPNYLSKRKLPIERHYGLKYLAYGSNPKVFLPVVSPNNICRLSFFIHSRFDQIIRT